MDARALTAAFVGFGQSNYGGRFYIPSQHKVINARFAHFEASRRVDGTLFSTNPISFHPDAGDPLHLPPDLRGDSSASSSALRGASISDPPTVPSTQMSELRGVFDVQPLSDPESVNLSPSSRSLVSPDSVAHPSHVIPRRSSRRGAPNVRLDGYQINSVTPTDPLEPRSIKEARLSPAWPQWKSAIQKELNSLISNGTWRERKRLSKDLPLPTKWVFKIKRSAVISNVG